MGIACGFGEQIADKRMEFDTPVLEFLDFNHAPRYPGNDPVAGCLELIGTKGIDGRLRNCV